MGTPTDQFIVRPPLDPQNVALPLAEKSFLAEVPLFHALLHDRDQSIRIQAATAVGDLKDPELRDSLLVSLSKSPDAAHRQGAAQAVGKIGDPALQTTVIQSLANDPDANVRGETVPAVIHLNDIALRDTLLEKLEQDESWAVQQHSVEIIQNISNPAVRDSLIEKRIGIPHWSEVPTIAFHSNLERQVSLLKKWANHPESVHIRDAAAKTAALLQSSPHQVVLILALADNLYESVQSLASAAAGSVRDPALRSGLIQELARHRNPSVRCGAAEAAAHISNPLIRDQIYADLAKDPHKSVRASVAWQLDHVSDPALRETLVHQFAGDDYFDVNRGAARALGHVADFEKRQALIEKLVNAANDMVRYDVVSWVPSLADPKRRQSLLEKLSGDRSVEVRTKVAETLAGLDAETFHRLKYPAKLLKHLAKDQKLDVREAVAKALANIPDAKLRQSLMNTLSKDYDAAVRASCAGALGAVHDPDARLSILKNFMRDEDYAVLMNTVGPVIREMNGVLEASPGILAAILKNMPAAFPEYLTPWDFLVMASHLSQTNQAADVLSSRVLPQYQGLLETARKRVPATEEAVREVNGLFQNYSPELMHLLIPLGDEMLRLKLAHGVSEFEDWLLEVRDLSEQGRMPRLIEICQTSALSPFESLQLFEVAFAFCRADQKEKVESFLKKYPKAPETPEILWTRMLNGVFSETKNRSHRNEQIALCLAALKAGKDLVPLVKLLLLSPPPFPMEITRQVLKPLIEIPTQGPGPWKQSIELFARLTGLTYYLQNEFPQLSSRDKVERLAQNLAFIVKAPSLNTFLNDFMLNRENLSPWALYKLLTFIEHEPEGEKLGKRFLPELMAMLPYYAEMSRRAETKKHAKELMDQATGALTRLENFISFNDIGRIQNVFGIAVNNWGRIGGLGLSFTKWQYDAMRPWKGMGPSEKKALLEQSGLFKSIPPRKDDKTYHGGYLHYNPATGLSIEMRRAYLAISKPGLGTLVIRNSSQVFGRNLLPEPAYFHPEKVYGGPGALLDPEEILSGKGFMNVMGKPLNREDRQIENHEKIGALLDAFDQAMEPYVAWKCGFKDGKIPEGFREMLSASLMSAKSDGVASPFGKKKNIKLAWVNRFGLPHPVSSFNVSDAGNQAEVTYALEVMNRRRTVDNSEAYEQQIPNLLAFLKDGLSKNLELVLTE